MNREYIDIMGNEVSLFMNVFWGEKIHNIYFNYKVWELMHAILMTNLRINYDIIFKLGPK